MPVTRVAYTALGQICWHSRATGCVQSVQPSVPSGVNHHVSLCITSLALNIGRGAEVFDRAHVSQIQLDELFALLRAVKTGEVSEVEAIERLSRSPHWLWAAIDPMTKLLLTINVGDRTLAMTPCVVHQMAQVLAPDCALLFLTDGFKRYTTALLTHFGKWVQPPHRWAQGPAPKPRWMPLPQWLYTQVAQQYRRRRLVGVRHRVVFGTLTEIKHVPAAQG
jgi:hypothetical protein